MYLARSIRWRGAVHDMVGIIPADVVMNDRPQGRGLVALEETPDAPWPAWDGGRRRAHEFHYASLENIDPNARFAYRMKRGYGVDGAHDGFVVGNLLASFSHLRDTDSNRWAQRFVSFVRNKRAVAIASGADRRPQTDPCARNALASAEVARVRRTSPGRAMASRSA